VGATPLDQLKARKAPGKLIEPRTLK